MLELTIVTPEGQAYQGNVLTVVLPGAEGQFGVLERHERALAPLQPGPVEIQESGGETIRAAVSAGFADVSAEAVVVLVDRCVRADEIDVTEAERARDELTAELAGLGDEEENAARREELAADLATAEAWIEVASGS